MLRTCLWRLPWAWRWSGDWGSFAGICWWEKVLHLVVERQTQTWRKQSRLLWNSRREPDRGGTPDREHRGRQWALLRRCRQAGWGGGWATGSRWAAPQLGKRPDEAFVEEPSVPRRWDGMKLEAGAVTGNKTSYPPGTSRALGPPDRQKGSRERAISGAPSLHGPRTGGERGAVRWWLASV